MSIVTKTGDQGTTGIFCGTRVSKDSDIIEAIGNIDELNSMIGVVRSHDINLDIDQIFEYIQNRCFVIGAQMASLEMKKKEMTKIEAQDVAKLEGYIEQLEKQLPELHNFILPSGHLVASQLFLTRAVCRRAERSIVRLDKTELLEVLKFTNRLSDLLFLLARSVNQSENKKETIWSR